MAVPANQITEEVVEESEPPARKRKIEVASSNAETGETVSVLCAAKYVYGSKMRCPLKFIFYIYFIFIESILKVPGLVY